MSPVPDLKLVRSLLGARKSADVESILAGLSITPPGDYEWDYRGDRSGAWVEGNLHWIPVGRERGNAGRINLGGEPMNPIAERLVNGMEAIIELARLEELQSDPAASAPSSARAAAQRYFELPRLDSMVAMESGQRKALQERIVELRKRLFVRLDHDNGSKQFAVSVRDAGVGQTPDRVHDTMLSLGESDKAKKPYLIGVFGQGGSSSFSASEYSVVISRRAPTIRKASDDAGLGWTIVRRHVPELRRDPYYAYLAIRETGEVPRVDAAIADEAGFFNGTHFAHINYDFGGTASSVSRMLYQGLNHVLFNPVLPYDLYALKDKPEQMLGTAYRLALQVREAHSTSALSAGFNRVPVI